MSPLTFTANPLRTRADLQQLARDLVTPTTVHTPAGLSSLQNLFGERASGSVDLGANSHLFSSLSTMPVLRSTHEAGEYWLVCRVSETPTEGEIFSAQTDANRCDVFRNRKLVWSSPCA